VRVRVRVRVRVARATGVPTTIAVGAPPTSSSTSTSPSVTSAAAMPCRKKEGAAAVFALALGAATRGARRAAAFASSFSARAFAFAASAASFAAAFSATSLLPRHLLAPRVLLEAGAAAAHEEVGLAEVLRAPLPVLEADLAGDHGRRHGEARRDLHIGCGRALKIGTRGCAVLGASWRAHCGRLTEA
jgi:hypothetical protein